MNVQRRKGKQKASRTVIMYILVLTRTPVTLADSVPGAVSLWLVLEHLLGLPVYHPGWCGRDRVHFKARGCANLKGANVNFKKLSTIVLVLSS